MDELKLLREIKPIWINRAVTELAHGSNLRENLRPQLEQFINLLEQSVESGDPSWLDPLLQTWASSITETDLSSKTSDLSLFLIEVMTLTSRVCRENLSDTQALALISTLIPIWGHLFQIIAELEISAKVDYISNQLDQVRLTLEKLDRSKSDFISIAAHELKTPLTLIDGYSAMLREALDQRESPANGEYDLINGISKGAQRLQDIINDMIDVSMIDNDLLSLNFQPVWINRIIAMIEAEAKPAIKERKQRLEIISITECSDPTYADSERILQVFRNLISNAIKYTPDGGRIKIYGRKLPGFIEVCFQDSGIGINLEDQTAIFERFNRLGNAALHSSGKVKFKGGGPGLGLHIARGIIEAHGGSIWVESPGHDEKNCPGSIFHVLIPARSELPDNKSVKLLGSITKY